MYVPLLVTKGISNFSICLSPHIFNIVIQICLKPTRRNRKVFLSKWAHLFFWQYSSFTTKKGTSICLFLYMCPFWLSREQSTGSYPSLNPPEAPLATLAEPLRVDGVMPELHGLAFFRFLWGLCDRTLSCSVTLEKKGTLFLGRPF